MRPSPLLAAALTGFPLAAAQTTTSSCTTSPPWAASPAASNPTAGAPTLATFTDTTGTTTITITGSSDPADSSNSIPPFASYSSATATSAAAPADGLAGDRSVLGLVVFFALSLCLL